MKAFPHTEVAEVQMFSFSVLGQAPKILQNHINTTPSALDLIDGVVSLNRKENEHTERHKFKIWKMARVNFPYSATSRRPSNTV